MTEIQHDNPALDLEKDPLLHAAETIDQLKGIQAFQQRPPLKNSGQTSDRIKPHDLFSLFTADIIEKNMIFVR